MHLKILCFSLRLIIARLNKGFSQITNNKTKQRHSIKKRNTKCDGFAKKLEIIKP